MSDATANSFSEPKPFNINFATGSSDEISAAIDDMFTYHPWDEKKTVAGKQIREALAAAVKTIVQLVPPSPDRTTAIRKLREARMDCNSALTFDGKY